MTEYIHAVPRREQDKRGKIRTYTGRYVSPLKLRASDIDIRDIAHHTSHICRYTGACPTFYSVAQHSVLVSELCSPGGRDLALAGLLHDAAEAYFNDLASPVKHDPRMAFYRDLEHETSKLILCVFGLDPDLLKETKPADDELFRREAATWWRDAGLIECWSSHLAEQKFLSEFKRLTELQ